MDTNNLRIAITQGDTNGVGYELIFKALADPAIAELCTPIIYGSPKIAAYHRNALSIDANFSIISKAEDAQHGKVSLLTSFEEEVKVELGVASEEAGDAALRALDRAISDWKEGLADVVVTAPLNNNDKFHFSGQSRYIEDHIEEDGKGLTILVNPRLRIALATRNLPLKQVAESITKDSVVDRATTLYNSLRRDFRISNPRIAVLALNPKGGENGLLGTEETDVLAPAIEELNANGIRAFGPYAADEFFGQAYYVEFDAVLAMYYDQAFVPFRQLSNGDGVNFTAGLSMVRTAPDAGTQLEVAGKNYLSGDSLRSAIYLAIDVARNRAEYDEAIQNPLPKLYKEKRDDSDKARFVSAKKRGPVAKPAEDEAKQQ